MTMTDTEAKALALVSIDPKALEHACLCAGRSVHHFDRMGDDLPLRSSIVAHARAIEQHEAFRQEVSEAVQDYIDHYRQEGWLGFDHFIIAKPDPLVEAMADCGVDRFESWADRLRAAIEARGGKIVWEAGE